MRVTSHKTLGAGLLAAVGAWLTVAAPALASVGELEPLRYKASTHGATAGGSLGAATWIIVGLVVAMVLAVTAMIHTRSSHAFKQSKAQANVLPTTR